MKGLVNTDVFMKAVLNKEKGLLPIGSLLSHITVFNIPQYPRLLIASDVAIIPLPTLAQKIIMTKYLVEVANKLGIAQPKIAFIAATEKVINSMPATCDAARLTEMAIAGEFGNALCEGPLSLDLAIDPESVRIKQFKSEVAGKADCLLFPNIESGNVFYKTNTKFCDAQTATVVFGTNNPIVLTSRGDSMTTKLNSIALAALLGENE
jgi:phosphotransacetylase